MTAASFAPFTPADLELLPPFEPPGWGDLQPRFQWYLSRAACMPVKALFEGRMAAVGAAILHADTAWLATIITHPDLRGRGLGTALTQHLIRLIDRSRYASIYLEATDEGYPVYLKLGFVLEMESVLFQGEQPGLVRPEPAALEPFSARYTAPLLELDREVSGEHRREVLLPHLPDTQLYIQQGELLGAYWPTLGEGMIQARTAAAGQALMLRRLRDTSRASAPVANETAIAFWSHYLTPLRRARRMVLGPSRPWRPEWVYNRISGQLG
ncbi:MAG: GNAT family N-acetyltransferase [Bacteroidia bacterium]|nr:GNAT family N-acetyltransferase [Bacteroidia bacterium]